MDHNLSFHKALIRPKNSLTSDKNWDKVVAAHKQKDYKATVLGILDYVDEDIIKTKGNADNSEFTIPHGSAELHLKITDSEFIVEAPFLNIATSKKIPLMRKVAELNFSPLNLSSITLNGDQLSFHYACPLDLCEPYRTYDALREICVYADSYDDEFISKFDANWIHEPKIQSYSTDEKEDAWTNMQLYIDEALSAINYFENKRSFNFAWDIVTITLMKIEYFIKPQGLLRIEIEKIIGYMTGGRDPINEKINRGKSFFKKLKEYDRAEFDKDLYRTETFIPYKVRSNFQAVKNHSENAFAQSKKEMESGNHLAATMTLVYQFFYLFYHNNVPFDITEKIENGLANSSGKPFQESATVLFQTLESVIQNKKVATPEKKKGLFNRLFG